MKKKRERGDMGITFGARDGEKSTSALGCKAAVMDSVAHGNLVFFRAWTSHGDANGEKKSGQ